MRPFMAEHSNKSRQSIGRAFDTDKIFGCHTLWLLPAPMRVFPRSIKLPLDVSVQCSQQANARHHVGPLARRPGALLPRLAIPRAAARPLEASGYIRQLL